MTTTQWRKVQEIFDAAVERPLGERAVFLDEACGDDADLRAEVESLLEHDSVAPPDFMEPPDPGAKASQRGSSKDSDPLIGERIGGYHIKGVIASGGMGTVYEAVQETPRRVVALKVMHRNVASRSALRRFQFESQILARLRHPNIAQVFAAGMHTLYQSRDHLDQSHDSEEPEASNTPRHAVPYFAMEYIPGAKSLIRYAAEKELGKRDRLRLFAKVCDAVHHGHQKGIIHRDLKPANILVDSSGEPKVIDFGVARATDSDLAITTQQTNIGQLVGTMQYMSPEQCDADPHDLDTRSDVYSLSVVLYELLTGELPYKASSGTIYQATQIIKESAPRRLSSINAKLRGDVETIVLKALEKDRDRRYQSAVGLALDIRRFLSGETISARPPTLTYQFRMFSKRNKAFVVSFALVFLTLIAATGVSTGFAIRAQKERDKAERANTDAQEQKKQATIQAYAAKIRAAESALHTRDVAGAYHFLGATDEQFRRWEWRHINKRIEQSLRSMGLSPGRIFDNDHMVISQSGRRVAIGYRINGQEHHGISIFDTTTQKQLQDFTLDNIERPLSFSPDGDLLVTCVLNDSIDQKRGTARLWRLNASGDPTSILSWRAHEDVLLKAAFFHSKRRMLLATGSSSGMIKLWGLSELETLVDDDEPPPLLATIPGHTRGIYSLIFSPDGRRLASGSSDFTTRLWDVEKALAEENDCGLAVLIGHNDHVNSVAFSPDGKRLATASTDNTIRLWDVEASIRQAEETGNNTQLESELEMKAKRLNDAPETAPGGVTLGILTGHDGSVMTAAFDAEGRRLVSGGGDWTLRVWDVDEFTLVSDSHHRRTSPSPRRHPINTLRGHSGAIRNVAFLPEGRIVSAADDGTARLWAADVEDVWRLREHYSSVNAVACTPDGEYAISAGGDACFIMWDTRLCVPVARRLLRNGEMINDLACWNDNGHIRLATATSNEPTFGGSVLVWNLDNPANPHRIGELKAGDRRKHSYYSIAVSQNGKLLAAGDHTGRVLAWEIGGDGSATGFSTHDTPGSDSGSVGSNTDSLLNLEPVFILEGGHTEQINGLVFLDKEGDWLVTSGDKLVSERVEHTIQLWEVDSGREVSKYSGHEGTITALVLSPDRRTLASASFDKTIRLWSVVWSGGEPSLAPGKVLKGHTNRIYTIAFHPTENRLVSGSHDRRIKVWDYEMGVEVATLREHKSFVRDLAFDSTGRRLISASGGFQGSDNVARLWETWEGYTPTKRTSVLSERATLRRAQNEVWRLLRNEGLSLKRARQRIENSGDQLPKDVRKAALERWDDLSADWYWFQMRAGYAAKNPELSNKEYREALNWAEAALKIAHENDLFILTAATLHYRLGVSNHNQQGISDEEQHGVSNDDRLKSLNDALKLIGPATAIEGICQPGAWALAALAHHALGHTTQSEKALQEMTKLMRRDVSWRLEALILVEEARRRFVSESGAETLPLNGSIIP